MLHNGNHRALIQHAQLATSIVSADQHEDPLQFKRMSAEKMMKINKSIDPLHQSINYSRTTPVSTLRPQERKHYQENQNICIQKRSSIMSTKSLGNENPVDQLDTQENEEGFEPVDMRVKSSISLRKHSE